MIPNFSISRPLLSLIGLIGFSTPFAYSQTNILSYWDFNSSPNGTALQSVTNTGTIPAPWAGLATTEGKADGAGNFTISGTGNWTRKAALATPLTSGKYRAELNLSGWNINSDVTGVNNFAFKVLDATSGNNMANFIFDIQSNTNVRVRYSTYASSDNGATIEQTFRDGASYSLLQAAPVSLAIDFDFDNNTVDYLLNGTSLYTSTSTTSQFWGTQAHTLSLVKAGTWGSNSTLSIDSFGLKQIPVTLPPTPTNPPVSSIPADRPSNRGRTPSPTNRVSSLPQTNFNVLFLPVDDLKPLIQAYGELPGNFPRPKTPNLDRLASRSMVFTRAYCQQAVCNASRASLLTGLRPDWTRCWDLETFFRTIPGNSNVVTIPQHFGAQGYNVSGVGKVFHGGSASSQDPLSWNQGWQSSNAQFTWYESAKAAAEDGGNKKISATDAGTIHTRDGNRPIKDDDYDDGLAASYAKTKITAFAQDFHANGKKFFLAVGFKKPHLPFNCPKSYWDLYDPSSIDLQGYDGSITMPTGTLAFTAPFGGEPTAYDDILAMTNSVSGKPNQTAARQLIHGYLACVSFMDAQVGKVLDALEDPNGDGNKADSVANQTIIVLWGDHGFHLGDHNGFWSKHSNYEQATRVPFMISVPGMSNLGTVGTYCEGLVELVDIFPTLIQLCSLPPPAQPSGLEMQGSSLVPLLEDPNQPWKKAAFSQYHRSTISGGSNNGKGIGYSVRTRKYRYTEWWRTVSSSSTVDLDALVTSQTAPQHVELYDYDVDPSETTNRATNPAYASVILELKAILHAQASPASSGWAGDGWSLAAVDAPSGYPTNLNSWKNTYATPGVSPSQLDALADPDGDGVANLLEYKMGTDPLAKNSAPWVVVQQSGQLRLEFAEATARTDCAVVPWTSSTLTGTWGTGGITQTSSNAPGGWTIRSAAIPTSGSSGFLQLRATTP